MANLHYSYDSDEIRSAIEGKHDLATPENVSKLIALDQAGILPNSVDDSVRANFENPKFNCVGDDDWAKVIALCP